MLTLKLKYKCFDEGYYEPVNDIKKGVELPVLKSKAKHEKNS